MILPVPGLELGLVVVAALPLPPRTAQLWSWSVPPTLQSPWKLPAACGSTGEEDPRDGCQLLTGFACPKVRGHRCGASIGGGEVEVKNRAGLGVVDATQRSAERKEAGAAQLGSKDAAAGSPETLQVKEVR